MLSYQLDRFDQFRNMDKEWTTFAIEATARAMNVTADRISSHPGPVTRLYIDDVGHLVEMFARMMYWSLLGEPLPSAQREREEEEALCT